MIASPRSKMARILFRQRLENVVQQRRLVIALQNRVPLAILVVNLIVSDLFPIGHAKIERAGSPGIADFFAQNVGGITALIHRGYPHSWTDAGLRCGLIGYDINNRAFRGQFKPDGIAEIRVLADFLSGAQRLRRPILKCESVSSGNNASKWSVAADTIHSRMKKCFPIK